MKTEIRSLIHAELIDSNKCIAGGLMANGYSPILELCRRLVTAGYDPALALRAYRSRMLCIKISPIGFLARFIEDAVGARAGQA
jgi:hypothetical protein